MSSFINAGLKLEHKEKSPQSVQPSLPVRSHPSSSSRFSSVTSPLTISSSSESPIPIIQMKELSNLERIGEGSQGIVYKAQWNGRMVIYKQMRLLTRNEGDEKKNFEMELAVWQYVLLVIFVILCFIGCFCYFILFYFVSI